jgi:hypothetical protein
MAGAIAVFLKAETVADLKEDSKNRLKDLQLSWKTHALTSQ